MESEIILSICIPTYNRDWCVKEQIERIKQCPESTKQDVEFIISDNCSTDNTESVARDAVHSDLGIKYTYVRNSENEGMDGNFVQCFNLSKGKYVWLLGDDDYLNIQILPNLLELLKKDEYGLVHISQSDETFPDGLIELENYKDYLKRVGVYITFISANIFRADYVCKAGIKWDTYRGTLFSQLPMYVVASHAASKNAIINMPILDACHNAVNNGGYNFFKTWVTNYLYVWSTFKKKGIITNQFYNWNKRNMFYFVWGYTKKLLIRKDTGNFKTDNGWKILFKNYGNEWYFWWTLFKYPFGVIKRKIKKLI